MSPFFRQLHLRKRKREEMANSYRNKYSPYKSRLTPKKYYRMSKTPLKHGRKTPLKHSNRQNATPKKVSSSRRLHKTPNKTPLKTSVKENADSFQTPVKASAGKSSDAASAESSKILKSKPPDESNKDKLSKEYRRERLKKYNKVTIFPLLFYRIKQD